MCNGGVSHTSLLSIIIKEYEGCAVDTSAMHILGFPKLEALARSTRRCRIYSKCGGFVAPMAVLL